MSNQISESYTFVFIGVRCDLFGDTNRFKELLKNRSKNVVVFDFAANNESNRHEELFILLLFGRLIVFIFGWLFVRSCSAIVFWLIVNLSLLHFVCPSSVILILAAAKVGFVKSPKFSYFSFFCRYSGRRHEGRGALPSLSTFDCDVIIFFFELWYYVNLSLVRIFLWLICLPTFCIKAKPRRRTGLLKLRRFSDLVVTRWVLSSKEFSTVYGAIWVLLLFQPLNLVTQNNRAFILDLRLQVTPNISIWTWNHRIGLGCDSGGGSWISHDSLPSHLLFFLHLAHLLTHLVEVDLDVMSGELFVE